MCMLKDYLLNNDFGQQFTNCSPSARQTTELQMWDRRCPNAAKWPAGRDWPEVGADLYNSGSRSEQHQFIRSLFSLPPAHNREG